MNDPAFHYRQAESYLQGAALSRRAGEIERAELLVKIAQVHATLALAFPDSPMTVETATVPK